MTFTVVAGANIVCTFTNAQDAKVTVVKEASPEGSTSFDFDGTGSGIDADFDLVDDGVGSGDGDIEFTIPASQLGEKTITESALAGWSLTDRDCTGVTESKPANGVTFTVVAGANIVCTFTNAQDAKVTVVKEASPEGSTSFDFDGTGSGIDADFDLVDDGVGSGDGDIEFTIPASQLGEKTITESALAGWSLTDRDCTGVTESKPANGVTFTVVAGANIVCTFTNAQDAKVTVVKEASPEGSTSFDFDGTGSGIDADFDLVDDGVGSGDGDIEFTIPASQLGEKTITESALAGWSLTDRDCTGVTESKPANGVTFTVVAGANIVCTFTNAQDAKVTVVKEASPEGSTSFDFDGTGSGIDADFDLVDDGVGSGDGDIEFTIPASQLGEKTITESALAGWSLTDRDCTGVTESKPANGVTFTVVAGANIVCTFTNAQDAKVTVVKEASPEGSTSFDFDGTGSGIDADFDLVDDGVGSGDGDIEFTIPASQLGEKTITESALAGWSLTDRDCTGVTESKPANGVTFTVVAGANIVCTFTNAQDAKVTVVKEASPEGSTSFDFDGTGSGIDADFDLVDDGVGSGDGDIEFTIPASQLGEKTITESALAGWSLTDRDCTGVTESKPANGVTFTVVAGANIVCTFTNAQDAKVTVVKEASPEGSTSFDFDGTGSGIDADFDLVDDGVGSGDGDIEFTIPASQLGEKTITESALAGWSLTDRDCTGVTESKPANGVTFTVVAGANIVCTFTNAQDAKVTVVKEASPEGSTSFDFDGTGSGIDADFDLVDDGVGSGDGDIEFTIPASQLGEKTITESALAGWSLTDRDCTGVTESKPANGVTFTVVAGANIVCTFTNAQDAKVTVVKEASPEGSTSFDFDGTGSGIDADFDLVDDGVGSGDGDIEFTIPASQLGEKTITESALAGWSLTDRDCTGVTESKPANGVTFTVVAGANIVCTFTNAQDAKVTVVKEASPEGSTSFDFDGTGSGIDADFDLVDDGVGSGDGDIEFTIPASQLGEKTITESALAGWSLTDRDCTGVTESKPANGVTFTVVAGANIVCTFTNAQDAKVTVVKEASPEGSTSFDFDGTGSGIDADFDLVDDGVGSGDGDIEFTIPASQLGEKTITESALAGWSLTDRDCTGVTESKPANGVTFTVVAGANIVCTFTNTRHASVTLTKVTVPGSQPDDFVFTSTSSGLTAGATLDTDPQAGTPPTSKEFPILPAQFGEKTVTEAVPANWDLSGVDCTGTNSESFSNANNSVTFTVGAGDTIVCTFTNESGFIEIVKQLNPTNDGGRFNLNLDGGNNEVENVGHNGATGERRVTPGTHTVAESAFTGTDASKYNAALECRNGNGSGAIVDSAGGNVAVGAGDDIVCVFTNTRRTGTLTVVKDFEPNDDPGRVDLNIDGGTAEAPNVGDGGTTGATTVSADWHTVSEAAAGSTNLSNYVSSVGCADGQGNVVASNSTGAPQTLFVDSNQAVTCTFLNKRKARASVLKTVAGQVDPSYTWTFSLVGPGVNVTDTTAADGTVDFNGEQMIPGQQYTICEYLLPVGWNVTFRVNGTQVATYNPDATKNPPEDLGTRCYNFTPTSGQVLAFAVDNTHPLGGQRTIGYWKNWNRCTGGNQSRTADKNGGPAAGFFLIENVLPQTVGNLVIPAPATPTTTNSQGCLIAVRILGKSDINSGKSMSSDGAYNLAAQLLAAMFNVQAGAKACNIQQTIDQANALLRSINFRGTGAYLPSKGGNQPLRAQANALAKTLDDYNNGKTCF